MFKDSFLGTIIIAGAVCLVCSLLVSVSAVSLRPTQEINKQLDKKKNILKASGLYEEGVDIDKAFESIEEKVVDLETGEYVEVENFDQKKASKTPSMSKDIENDFAGIKRRSLKASIYLVKENNEVQKVILPVHGKGLWSTMYGFLALDMKDQNTVKGITYYEHGETPGLGGEIENAKWQQSWVGKKVFDNSGEVSLKVIKGSVNLDNEKAIHQIDGLSGATLTSNGVSNTLKYWLGKDGFGPYLEKLSLSSKPKGETNVQ